MKNLGLQLKLNQAKVQLTQSWNSGLVFSAGGGFDFKNKGELKSTKECPRHKKFPTNSEDRQERRTKKKEKREIFFFKKSEKVRASPQTSKGKSSDFLPIKQKRITDSKRCFFFFFNVLRRKGRAEWCERAHFFALLQLGVQLPLYGQLPLLRIIELLLQSLDLLLHHLHDRDPVRKKQTERGDLPPKKSLAEICGVWWLEELEKLLQPGSVRLAGYGDVVEVEVVVVGGKGLGVFRKFMARSSNPVRKCGLR